MKVFRCQGLGRSPGARSILSRPTSSSSSVRVSSRTQGIHSHARQGVLEIGPNPNFPFNSHSSRRARGTPLRSVPPDNNSPGDAEKEDDSARESPAQLLRSKSGKADDPDGQFTIDSINPYSMGRKSRCLPPEEHRGHWHPRNVKHPYP
jgi:hypothetical protein